MANYTEKVIVGNVVLFPEIIRRFLIKSHYYLTYDPKKETITLNANHGYGGEVLWEVRNASHENAIKLADKLGLKPEHNCEGPDCVSWNKFNPVWRLQHDGSEDAEFLRMEMLKLGLPHTVSHVEHPRKWSLSGDGRGIYMPPSWTVESMKSLIQDCVKRNAEELNSTP